MGDTILFLKYLGHIMKELVNLTHNIEEKLLSVLDVNEYIFNIIAQSKNSLIGRFGGVEGRIVIEIIMKHNYDISEKNKFSARNNAGIGIPTNKNLKKFATEYLNAGTKVDLLGMMPDPKHTLLAQFSDNNNYCHLNCFNPFFTLDHSKKIWTNALKGKRVLIIHPFVESIKNQYSRRHKIKTISKILPEFDLLTLKPPMTTEENNQCSWLDELQLTKKNILSIDFDIAIIGAGAYGLPLGAFVKDIGKTAIQIGGITQILFGIIGKRWENRPHMQKYIGDGWIRPNESETPSNAFQVEQGCYW